MGNKLQGRDLFCLAISVPLPGVGHLLSRAPGAGLLALIAGGVAFMLSPPLIFVIGAISAVHLYIALTADAEPDALPEPPPRRTLPAQPTKRERQPSPEPREEPQPVDEPAPTEAEVSAPASTEPAPTPEPEPEPSPEVTEAPAPAEPSVDTGGELGGEPSEPPPALDEPSPADFSGEDYPIDLDPEDRQLWRLRHVLEAAERWYLDHDRGWTSIEPFIAGDAPEQLRKIAEELGGSRFDVCWSHGWRFPLHAEISLFERIEQSRAGYSFAEIGDAAVVYLWAPDGQIVERGEDGEETVCAPDLPTFLEEITSGLRVARHLEATEATMGPAELDVLPESERDRDPSESKAGFPGFWFGALGPGLEDVGFTFEAPMIRHARGSRVVDQTDIAVIVAFLEWLDSGPDSTEGALEMAKSGAEPERPIGVVKREGEIAVAWWGESPPEEVDALLEHLRGLTYYG